MKSMHYLLIIGFFVFACACSERDGDGDGDEASEGWVQIPAGTFTMGSPSDEAGRQSNETQHEVTLTRPFSMQTTEVTQGQWKALSGGVNPSSFVNCGDDCPVERVDWYSALGYANALSALQGLQACYTLTGCTDPTNGWKNGEHSGCTGATFVGLNCTGYRLPTEAEWEYAARAGTTTAFYTGGITHTDCSPVDSNLDRAGWYCGNSSSGTKEVGMKEPNAWGLYDMHGNVWEWTWDGSGSYPDGSVTDPLESSSDSDRVLRGGCWNNSANSCRAAYRNFRSPSHHSRYLGLRLCRSL